LDDEVYTDKDSEKILANLQDSGYVQKVRRMKDWFRKKYAVTPRFQEKVYEYDKSIDEFLANSSR